MTSCATGAIESTIESKKQEEFQCRWCQQAYIHKQNVTRFPYEISRIAQDIAGHMVTMPAEQDFNSPETGKWLEKYYTAHCDAPTINRMRILRLIEGTASDDGIESFPTRFCFVRPQESEGNGDELNQGNEPQGEPEFG